MEEPIEEKVNPRKKQILDGIEHLISTIEDMPPNARASFLTQYDQLAMLLLIKELLLAMNDE